MNGISSSRNALIGLPALSDSSSASSSACSSIASASFSSANARSPGVVAAHPGNAVFAALTARLMPSAVMRPPIPPRGKRGLVTALQG